MPLSPDSPLRNPHPLPPDGSFRGGRLPAALATDFVAVDEKTMVEGVEFVRRMAQHIQYINRSGVASGSWASFYERQPAVLTARLLSWPLERLGKRLAEYRELIEDHQSPIPKEQLLHGLFDLVSSLALALDRMTEELPASSSLRQLAEALIVNQLAPAYKRWLAYYLAAAPAYFGTLGVDQVPDYLRDAYAAGGQLIDTEALLTTGGLTLKPRWNGGEPWADYLTQIAADPAPEDATVFGPGPLGTDNDAEIIHALGHTFFHGVYEAFLGATLHLRSGAQKYWEALLAQPSHQPHITLLLTYLEMRQTQREMLNELTDKHLDYYYRRVLRTEAAASQPPQAHLALEARKNLPATYLPAGTPFRGGKDETGLARTFHSQEGITVLPAKIVAQRAVFKVHNQPATYDFPGENRLVFPAVDAGRVYAATVVNSPDGEGEEDLPEGTLSWHPFGYKRKAGGTLAAGMTPARIGFVLASHYLFMREGSRNITFGFTGTGLNDLVDKTLKVDLSTAKGWIEKKGTVDSNFRLKITLSADEESIVPYNEEVHLLGIETNFPVARFTLLHDEKIFAYHSLRNVRIKDIQVSLVVNGLRNLQLSGPTGPLDSSQPFFPFGPAPSTNAVFNVGADEVFQKTDALATINWTWQNAPTKYVPFSLERLNNGTFEETTRTNAITGVIKSSSMVFWVNEPTVIPPSFGGAKNYQSDAIRGFARLKLLNNYGHAEYPEKLAGWTAEKADYDKPDLPFEAKMAAVTMNYWVFGGGFDTINNQRSTHQYFHLTAFGSKPVERKSGRFPLMPSLFPAGNWGADAGALYIGIEQWEAGPALSLLFQIEEGTADPLLEKPEEHLFWHYLDGNEWIAFDATNLVDGTDQLLRTGVVLLDLPQNVDLNCSRMGSQGVQWVRVSALEKTEAVNRLRGIHPNGVRVVQSFSDGQAATDTPLPAETIAKMSIPVPGVKTVSQPYASFAGSAVEDRDGYFTRLSERLRHKDRALMEWDVEHLVLQAFPEVERVVCLNHLEFAPGAVPGEHLYHELRAGHFTVIPLGRSGGESLRPYVSLSSREAINDFLKDRISCHATLHVRNPLIEEVRVVSGVRFHATYDESWALQQIQFDLIDFLSPWFDEGLGELDFTAGVKQSAVVNFLEELAYIDYVKDLSLLHLSDPTQNNKELLQPTKLVSLLASAPSHNIRPLAATDEVRVPEVCSPRRARRRARLMPQNPVA